MTYPDMMPGRKTFTHFNGTVQTINAKRFVTVNNINAVVDLCVYGAGLATPPDYLLDDALANNRLSAFCPTGR
jgi:DNA-binding transcriptional LysR family regulator